MPRGEESTLRDALSAGGRLSGRVLSSADASVRMGDLISGTSLARTLDVFHGRSVLVATDDQLTAMLAFIELDGIARRLVLCPPDLPLDHVASVKRAASIEVVVSDRQIPDADIPPVGCQVACSPRIVPADFGRGEFCCTEWVLLTSGTTGLPKMISHTLASLAGAIGRDGAETSPAVWSTFYDIRRYGGLQVALRALLGGGSLVLSSARESVRDFLVRAGTHGVTHISGTPSHWRRALMSPAAHNIKPQYVRLSGEVADQAILDQLRAFYPWARVAHAFASTEAGVAFDVRDGRAGFPASLIETGNSGVEMKVEEGSLRIRSARTAARYLTDQGSDRGMAIADTDGFVDTGDMVELRDGRYHFVGRRDGTINVGGLKVHPEEVEAVINRHPRVQMSLVKARKSPITGAVVAADIVAKTGSLHGDEADALKVEILASCQSVLPPHKVPAVIRLVPSLDVAASGKLTRPRA